MRMRVLILSAYLLCLGFLLWPLAGGAERIEFSGRASGSVTAVGAADADTYGDAVAPVPKARGKGAGLTDDPYPGPSETPTTAPTETPAETPTTGPTDTPTEVPTSTETGPAPSATPTGPYPGPPTNTPVQGERLYLPLIFKNRWPVEGCSDDLIENGGFEWDGSWNIPITSYSAGYTIQAAHSGSRAMRLGIDDTSHNIYSYSDVNQTVTIPADATIATLGFWLYTFSADPAAVPTPMPRPQGGSELMDYLTYDVQYLLVLDEDERWIDTLMWQCSDEPWWTYYETNMMAYAGRTIKLHFGAYNTGWGGVTGMYLDDVSLDVTAPSLCPSSTPVPSNTPSTTPSYTPIQTVTPAPTMTLTPTPAACVQDIIVNGGFEWLGTWYIPATQYSAGYTDQAMYTGSWSMRLGIDDANDNRHSYSDINQTVTIPSDATSAILGFWFYPFSGDPGVVPTPMPRPQGTFGSMEYLNYDVQYVLILDASEYWIDTLMWQCSNDQWWTYHQADLTAYAGRTIKLHFGAYNTGWGGVTGMYLDDVSLTVAADSLCP